MGTDAYPFHLHTLGEHRITKAGRACDVGAYGFAMVSYIALSRRTPTRSELCHLLWDGDGSDERHRLRQLLYSIRRRAPGVLVERGHNIDRSAIIVDAIECREALRAGQVEDAVSLYGGHFLEAFPSLSRPFEDWRDAAAADLVESLRRSVRARLRARDISSREIVLLATWLKEYDSLEVREGVRFIRALADLGRTQEAEVELQLLDSAELTREDHLEVDALAQRLRSPASSSDHIVPVVLSETIRREIAAHVTDGHQPITLLIGESGVGKTRLLDWIARLAALRGARVLSSRATLPSLDTPRKALRRFMSDLRLPEDAIAKIATVDIASAAGAAADYLSDRWTVIAIDNINHADNAIREFCRILPAMSKSRALTVVCATTGDATAEEAAWISSLLPNIEVVRVPPLDDHMSAVFLERIAAANGYAFTEGQRSLIIDEGRGIPRRIIRMAEAIADGTAAGSMWELDARLAQRVIRQIESLSTLQQMVLGCSVLSEKSLDVQAIAKTLHLTEEEVLGGLQAAADCSLVRSTPRGPVATEQHVKKAYLAVVSARVQNEVRHALASFHSANEEHLLAAEHYEGVGDRQTAGAQYALAAQKAMGAGLFENVEKVCKAALSRSTTADEYQSRSRLLASYYCRVGRWEDAYPYLLAMSERTAEEELALLTGSVAFVDGDSDEAWKEVTERLSDMQAKGVDRAGIARAYLVAFDRAYQYGKEAVILPEFKRFLEDRSCTNPRELAEIMMKSARINQLFGDSTVALDEASEAVALAASSNDPVVLANAYDTRALIRFLKGHPDSAFQDFEESERIAASAALYFLRERYYNNLAVLYYETGKLTEARRLLRTAALFSPHVELYALANLAVIELSAYNFDLASSYGLRLRSTGSVTHSIIGLTVCGIADLATGNLSSAQQAFWDLHHRTNAFQLQLTDPSYTLAFAAECAPAMGIDPLPAIHNALTRIAPRNIYSFLRLRLTLARSLMTRKPAEALDICRSVLTAASAARAATTYAQAEALLAAS